MLKEKEVKEGTKFEIELTSLLNRHSRENISNTPDFILAQYLMGCLKAGEHMINEREKWHKMRNM